MKNRLNYHIICLLSMLFLASSCNTLKYIPEDEKLYTGADISIKGKLSRYEKGELKEELNLVTRPKPNEKILGIRLGLWARQRVNRGVSTFYSRWINKRIGEEAVLLSEIDLNSTNKLMRNRLENKGYFYSQISSKKSPGRLTGVTKFTIRPGTRLLISEYQYDSVGIPLMDSLLTEYTSREKTIKPKAPFDLYMLKQARSNISHYLKEQGYYYFNADYLIFDADSVNTTEPNRVKLTLMVKENTPEAALAQYKIGDITVFPHYTLLNDSTKTGNDTAIYKGVEYIQDGIYFYPAKLHPYLLFKEGDLYDEEEERFTSRRLNSLQNYRYVSIRFQRDSTLASGYGTLNTSIYLSPLKKRSFVAEFQGTSKSNNFVGTALTLEYLNRNIFHGAETFSLKGKVGYEAQLAGGELSGLNSLETGIAAEYRVPRLVSPFHLHEKFRYSIPKTKFRLSYDVLRRVQYYSLNSFLGLVGYEWNVNAYVTHNLNPISVNLINIAKKTAAFEELLNDNSFLRRSFEQQFIPALSYSYQYNKLLLTEQRSRFLVLFNAELAGNMFGLIQNIGGNSGTNKSLFGVEYAQYNKFDIDVRNYFDVTQNSQFVTRFFTGWGFPYGNSQSLPYSKQYFSGGPNSLRAFRIRSVGPGNYSTTDETSTSSFFDQTGDIKVEGNLEYRFPIFSYFKGAVFADAGNVWLQNGDPENNFEGEFTKDWSNQIAVGAGIGLRLDIQFVVVRLDVATPLRKADASGTFTWQDNYQFGNKSWRQQNIVWNFAIGYPF
jgi:outer membrane protein insertion porin family